MLLLDRLQSEEKIKLSGELTAQKSAEVQSITNDYNTRLSMVKERHEATLVALNEGFTTHKKAQHQKLQDRIQQRRALNTDKSPESIAALERLEQQELQQLHDTLGVITDSILVCAQIKAEDEITKIQASISLVLTRWTRVILCPLVLAALALGRLILFLLDLILQMCFRLQMWY